MPNDYLRDQIARIETNIEEYGQNLHTRMQIENVCRPSDLGGLITHWPIVIMVLHSLK